MVDLMATGNESDNDVLFIQRADREAFFLYNLALAEGSGPVALSCGNLSGDSMPDIAVAASGVVSIFEQAEGDFTEIAISTSGAEYSPTGLLAADFNGNGRLDLLLSNALPPGSIEIFSERAGTGFTRSQALSGDDVQTQGGAFLPAAMAHADLDGDGEKDFVVANRSGDEMTVFWGGRR